MTSVAHILEAIKTLDESHHKWVLEQIRKGEEESEADDSFEEDNCE